jgi:P4 family phage/plasmid primase-like protien
VVENPPEILEFSSLQWFYPFGQSPQKGPAPKATRQQSAARVRQQSAAAATGSPPPNPQNIYADLFASFGAPFLKGRQGYSINQPFFARLWGTKRLAFYDQTAEDFFAYNANNGLFERLRKDTTLGLISGDILAEGFARKHMDVAGKINAVLLNSIANIVKTDPEVSEEDYFKLDPIALPVIHAANGMICITKDGAALLRPFDPDYRSRNLIPLAYVPDAKCISFLEQLLEPVMSTDDIDVLQRYCGLILLRGNRAQKILMLLGKGGVGKGTIVNLIGLIIGRDNVIQLRVGKLNDRFETSRVIGKLLLNIVEATADYLNQNGAEVMKALCGHDKMNAEKKNVQEPMEFAGGFPIIVTSNEALNVRMSGDEEAWSRRLVIIDLPKLRPKGSKIIDHFEEKLFRDEGEGILAWMIEGAVKHWKELNAKDGFQTKPEQDKRVEELIGRSKSAETFILTCLDSDPSKDLTTDELYDAYGDFCINHQWIPFFQQRFEEVSQYLIKKHLGIGKRNDVQRADMNGKMKSRRGYRGIKIK